MQLARLISRSDQQPHPYAHTQQQDSEFMNCDRIETIDPYGVIHTGLDQSQLYYVIITPVLPNDDVVLISSF